ncbi:hypothetical protein HPB48_022161 [Haemaphysalis longicornis]|uniref:Uncharacterized protein n=1 Tax=Haemaphysalis longicornis TaxID=44386 RepID=A0A9J6H750_HAELO|nr:hypothetical protein HPB48_022161 [Haemaphysalis longicornis]
MPGTPTGGREHRITNWYAFRQAREASPRSLSDLDTWVRELHQDVRQHTTLVPEEANIQKADARLSELCEALRSLRTRLKSHPRNRSLRRKIAQVQRNS